MMFEKAKPINARPDAPSGVLPPEARAHLRERIEGERIDGGLSRRAGDALRALEWSELTARLNAARDLRLLLRTEAGAPIEAVAASFGDAAASYFALLDESEQRINPDALGQSKALGAKIDANDAKRPDDARPNRSDAPSGPARDVQ